MRAEEAARYCAMSLTSFQRAVKSGDMPKGLKATGGTYWLRSELETAMLAETSVGSQECDEIFGV